MPVVNTTVDLSPIIQWAVGFVAMALGIIGSAVLLKLKQKLNLQISAGQEAAFDDSLKKGLAYGAGKATEAIAEKGWDHPEVKTDVVATALQQTVKAFPQALAGVGLSTNLDDPKNVEAITAALERAFPEAMAEASASPATPPVTAPNPETQGEMPPVATIHVVTSPAK